MKYEKFTVEDFVLDDFFIRWVKSPSDEANSFWELWLWQHPEKRELVAEAQSIVRSMNFKTTVRPGTVVERIHSGILTSTLDTSLILEDPIGTSDKKIHFLWPYVGKVAAAIFLLIASAFIFQYLTEAFNTVKHTTSFGQTKTICLPDGSYVTLNANSTIRYASNWKNQPRQVWLEGEAFFSVKKIKGRDYKKFLVHTGELDVEVLGTRFDVNNRKDKTYVVLNSGSVKVNLGSGVNSPSVLMNPGEKLEYSLKNKTITKTFVNPDAHNSWMSKKWILDGISLLEVGQMIEETYGVKVIIENKNKANEKLNGTISTQNLPGVLEGLSAIYNLRIERTNNKVVFKNK